MSRSFYLLLIGLCSTLFIFGLGYGVSWASSRSIITRQNAEIRALQEALALPEPTPRPLDDAAVSL